MEVDSEILENLQSEGPAKEMLGLVGVYGRCWVLAEKLKRIEDMYILKKLRICDISIKEDWNISFKISMRNKEHYPKHLSGVAFSHPG